MISKISVVVPVYNAKATLARCLTALQNQTFPDIQILIVDDESTDDSMKIANSFVKSDNRFHIIPQEHAGLITAWHTGLENVKTPYFMFCDADDYFEPNACEKMYNAITKNNADMAVCQVYLEGTSYDRPWLIDYFKPKILGPQTIIPGLIPLTNCVVWNKIYKTDLVRQHNLTFPKDKKIRRGYDVHFTLQYLLLCKKVFYLADKLCHYVLSDSSLSAGYFKKQGYFLDEIYGWEYVSDFILKKHLEYPEFYQFLNNRWSFLFDKTDDNYKRPTYLIMRKIIRQHKKYISKENPFLYNVLHNKKREIFDE